MSDLEENLQSIFGNDFDEEYISRVKRIDGASNISSISPEFSSHPAFSSDSEKVDFLIDERVISFFKIAPDQVNLALVLFNFSSEQVEVRWSPEFACDNIREIRQEELISLDEDELVFSVKPQQLQWVCLEKA